MAKDSGTVAIHGKEYKTVALRVNEFRESHKQSFSLESEIVSIDAEVVVMKAFIRDLSKEDRPVVAVGHAEEKRAASTINKTSALENCETSAYGRALAAFGLAGTEFASADEVAQAISQQNAPAAKWKPSPDKLASDNQKMFIANLLRQHGVESNDMKEWLADKYGIIGDMSQSDAQMIIDDLNTKEK